MKLQGQIPSVQPQVEDVKLLRSELRRLGFAIPAQGVDQKTFGWRPIRL